MASMPMNREWWRVACSPWFITLSGSHVLIIPPIGEESCCPDQEFAMLIVPQYNVKQKKLALPEWQGKRI